MKRYLVALIVVLIATVGFFAKTLSDTRGDLKTSQKALQEVTANYEYTKQQREDLQTAIQQTAQFYIKELQDNELRANDIISEHIANAKRLSVKLAATANGSPTDSNCIGLSLDGRAELHRETAESLVGITLDADAKVRALQDVIKQLTNKGE